jgi:hypothetical protein
LGVRVDGVYQGTDDVPDRSTRNIVELFPLGGVRSSSSLASRDAKVAVSSSVSSRRRPCRGAFEGDALDPVQRGVDEVVLGDPDGVHDDEPGLRGCVGGDGLEVGGGDGSSSAALHLLEVLRRADIAHEEDALQRFDVGAGGDHVDRDCDAQGGAGAERLQLPLASLAA